MPYSIDPLTADCYEGTACLISYIHSEKRTEERSAHL